MKMRALLLTLLVALPAAASDAPHQTRGFTPNQVYQIGDLVHVNIFNGNVMIRIPLGQVYEVGPVLRYQFILTYNSKVWDYATEVYQIRDRVDHRYACVRRLCADACWSARRSGFARKGERAVATNSTLSDSVDVALRKQNRSLLVVSCGGLRVSDRVRTHLWYALAVAA